MQFPQPGVMTSQTRRAVAGTSGAALVVLFALIRLVPVVGAADRSAFTGRLDSGTVLLVVERLALATVSVATLATGLLVLSVHTAVRQGIGPAARIAGSVVGAVVSAELLKHVLPWDPVPTRSGQFSSSGSFPSGHSAIAAAFALAVAATLGPRLARQWWGPLVAWVTLVAAATVAAGWHRPSDAVGGILLAVIWHTTLVRPRVSVEPPVVPRWHPGRSAPRIPGWRSWALMCALILVGALVPRTGSDVDLGEAGSRFYVLGLGAVLATTGALTLLGPPPAGRDRVRA